MPAFPEGWNIPKEFKKGEGKMSKDKRNPGPKREDREEIMEKVRELVAKGTSVRKAAKLLNVPESTIYHWLKQEREETQKQAQEPVPVQVGSQEPERENQEPAEDSITPAKNDGFCPEDNEPIPYVPVPLEDLIAELREDLDLERHKVADLEKKMDLLVSASANTPTPEIRLARFVVAVFRELEAVV
jgi:transposase-like protein